MSMLTWLHPGWLWGFAALAVPLLVHFLSRGPAQRVLIGSTRLLAAASSRRARRLRFTDPWLAALRVALLAAVVLALAGPLWQATGPTAPAWGLVHPALVLDDTWRPRHPEVATRLDGLARDGALRLLAAGLPAVSVEAARELTVRDAGGVVAVRDVWSLLREAEATAPPGTGFEVVTPGSLGELGAVRPALAARVSWSTVRLAPIRWTGRAWVGENGFATWRATSSAMATDWQRETVSEPASPEMVALAAAPPGPLRVALAHHPDREADARFVAAALQALGETGWLPLAVTRSAAVPTATAPDADAAVWLGPDAIPAAWQRWVEAGGWLLRDAVGTRFRDCATSVHLMPAADPVTVNRCAADDGADAVGASVPAVRDRQGRPFLLTDASQRIRLVTSRLHPAWSGLAEPTVLPRWLAGWLDQVAEAEGLVVVADPAGRDRRQAHERDRQPASAARAMPRLAGVGAADTVPDRSWLWAVVAALWVVERLVAARRAA